MAAAAAAGHHIRLDSSINQLHDDMRRIARIILAIAIERGYPGCASAARAGQNSGALAPTPPETEQAHGRLAAHFAAYLLNTIILAGVVHDQDFASDLRKSPFYFTKKRPDIACLVVHWNHNGNGGRFSLVIWRCDLILMSHIHNDESLCHNTGRRPASRWRAANEPLVYSYYQIRWFHMESDKTLLSLQVSQLLSFSWADTTTSWLMP